VHGTYRFKEVDTFVVEIQLSMIDNGQLQSRTYTLSQLQGVADQIGYCLRRFASMSSGVPTDLDPEVFRALWNIPSAQADPVQTLVERIRHECHSTIQLRFAQLP